LNSSIKLKETRKYLEDPFRSVRWTLCIRK